MGLGSLFGKLFGSKSESVENSEPPVEYKGLQVVADPIKEGGQDRTAGFIQQQTDDGLKSTRFIRADNHSTRDAAVTHALQKGKQIVDEQGESVLQRDHA